VLVIEGAIEAAPQENEEKDVEEIYKAYIKAGMDEKDAIKAAAKDAGITKREAYARIKIKN